MFIIISLWKRGQNPEHCSPRNPNFKYKFPLLGHAISISSEKQVLENECGPGFPAAINPNLLWHDLWGTEAVKSWCRGKDHQSTKLSPEKSKLCVCLLIHLFFHLFIGCFLWNCRIETGLKFIMEVATFGHNLTVRLPLPPKYKESRSLPPLPTSSYFYDQNAGQFL